MGKSPDEITRRESKNRKRKNFSSSKKNDKNGEGPRLPNSMQRELSLLNRTDAREISGGDEDIDSGDDAIGNDVYEYEDWKVAFDDEGDDDNGDDKEKQDQGGDEEKQDERRHTRMLKEITGLPSDAFGGRKRKDFIISETYPESEFNPSSDIIDGDGRIDFNDLVEPLHGKPGFSKLRKNMHRIEKKSIPTLAPLPKTDREMLERKAAYEHAKKDITKWEPLKKITSLANQDEFVEAHRNDGARLLELNKRDRIKAAAAIQMDPEAAKEQAMKQEFNRAREHLTLKHKNSNKWAKRILRRGLDVQDEATREAFGEQLHQHAALTRKINSLRESSSSDESSDSDDSDDMSAGSDLDKASNVIMKAKEKTLKALERDEQIPKSGVLSLPFMVRGLEKRREAADEEAKRALEEYESSLKQLEDQSASGGHNKSASNGRMVFGGPKKVVVNETRKKEKLNNYYGNSDSENDVEAEGVIEHIRNETSVREVDIDPNILREEFDNRQYFVIGSFGGTEDSEPKTMYEVAFLASDLWRKCSSNDAIKHTEGGSTVHDTKATVGTTKHDHNIEKNDEDSDTDSGGEMVDRILSSGPKPTYELPSQTELIQRAFANDDVEEDFEKDKEAILNEENPEPEKPVLLPGWGQWTHIQQKRGLPSWMVKEHEMAKKKRMEALKKRKDAHLNNVISEKLDKKAEKLHTKTLPYPYTSKEVFEQSIRMPIGPEFNPATAVGALNRPEVIKRPGVIIKPISYEDMSIHERAEIHKRNGQKQRIGKDRSGSTRKSTAGA
ncbi:hypothetical protein OROGR_000699 [Orobanche gracilis]